MKDQWFEIPGRLAGMNELYNMAKGGVFFGNGLKKRETKRCAEAAIGLKKIDHAVSLVVTWHEPNGRRDIDNVAAGIKFILDGLVTSGKLPNDGRKWVKSISHEFPEPDKKNPRVVVWIREYELGRI